LFSGLVWGERKTVRQQFLQLKEADPISLPGRRLRSRHTQAVEVWAGELSYNLAADATGHARLSLRTSHSQAPDFSGAFADRLENGGTLSTIGRAIGRVFDVAASENLAIGCFYGSTNREIRIGNIGFVTSAAGQGYQFLIRDHVKILPLLRSIFSDRPTDRDILFLIPS
jgi:hypothetical protein